VVWVAENFRNEHRAAIDWLNGNTFEGINFFAVEVEALKIGDSLPAPWFNVVSKPNDWNKHVKKVIQDVSNLPMTEDQVFNIDYWQAFSEYLSNLGSDLKFKTPNKHRCAWMGLRNGQMALEAWNRPDDPPNATGLQVDFWITGRRAKEIFQRLLKERSEIETAFGESLRWDELSDRQGSRVSALDTSFDITDKGSWAEQFEWMFTRLTKLRDLFAKRVNLIADQA
jgi:hypothetical protein